MRLVHSHIHGGEHSSIYALTMNDLERIVADAFGWDLRSVNIDGLEADGFEFHVSGTTGSNQADDPVPSR
jgi:hypothetical protein